MMKPILFNTAMVRAILDGRKTVTRRIVKNVEKYWGFDGMEMNPAMVKVRKDGTEYPFDMQGLYAVFEDDDGLIPFPMVKAPYQPGNILYVRETFFRFDGGGYAYKADGNDESEKVVKELGYKWRPSIHMPRAAARIFLRVTGVRVERLQNIAFAAIRDEGITWEDIDERDASHPEAAAQSLFARLWDSTLKPADLAIYGWDANPWVWVIVFEVISKEEAEKE